MGPTGEALLSVIERRSQPPIRRLQARQSAAGGGIVVKKQWFFDPEPRLDFQRQNFFKPIFFHCLFCGNARQTLEGFRNRHARPGKGQIDRSTLVAQPISEPDVLGYFG